MKTWIWVILLGAAVVGGYYLGEKMPGGFAKFGL